MKNRKKSVFREIIFVLIVSSFCVGLLLITHTGIGQRSEVSVASVNAALEIITGRVPQSAEEAYNIFNRRFVMKSQGKVKVWQNQDLPDQWVFEASGAGMWGEITIVGVLNLETSSLIGLRVVNQNETAGLGSRIVEPTFYEQFANLTYVPRIEMQKAKFKNNQFDAVSGATVTSRALEALLNKAVNEVLAIGRPDNGVLNPGNKNY